MDTAVAFTDAQERVLRVMVGVGRAVGGRTTNPDWGYVHTATARQLVEAGLLREEKGARGANVFTLTDAGHDAVLDFLAAQEAEPA